MSAARNLPLKPAACRTARRQLSLTHLLLSAIVLCAAATMHARGDGPTEPLDAEQRLAMAHEAQRHFDEAASLETRDPAAARASFAEAAALYRRIADSGVSNGELMLNLGNSLVKSGETSRAIAAYLDAERMLPGDARVADALAHARASTRARLGPITGSGPLDRAAAAWSAASLRARAWASLLAWLALWGVVAAGIVTGWRHGLPWRSVVAVAAVAAALPAATVAVDLLRVSLERPGVVVADSVVLRKGNGEGFAPAVEESLASGAEFVMLEERPGWVRIRLPDGQSGWIRQDDALLCGR